MPERPTSAFGALATTVPSASRTTMSRRRKEVRPFSSRSIWVPPTTTVCLPPKFSSIAAFSHGVAMSSSIGPLDRRHHRPSTATVATATLIAAPQNSRRMKGRRRNLTTPRREPPQRRRPEPCAGMLMRRAAGGVRVLGWMPVIVFVACHAFFFVVCSP